MVYKQRGTNNNVRTDVSAVEWSRRLLSLISTDVNAAEGNRQDHSVLFLDVNVRERSRPVLP